MAPGVVCRWSAENVDLGEVIAQAERMRSGESRTATRAAVVNLVVVTAEPETAQRARSAVGGLGAHHPGRIIIVLADPDGPERIDAPIELQGTDLPERHLWWEVIDLRVGGGAARHLSSVVEPLLVHDLPVAAWHMGEIPSASGLVATGAHVILGGDRPSDPDQSSLEATAALTRLRHVTDLEWLATEPWRRALALLFDPPSARRILPRIAGARVAGPPWRACLLGGWLTDRLGLAPGSVQLEAVSSETIVELAADDVLVRAASAPLGRVEARIDDERAVTVGGAERGTAALLAAALGRGGTDPAFVGALGAAARVER